MLIKLNTSLAGYRDVPTGPGTTERVMFSYEKGDIVDWPNEAANRMIRRGHASPAQAVATTTQNQDLDKALALLKEQNDALKTKEEELAKAVAEIATLQDQVKVLTNAEGGGQLPEKGKTK